MAVLELAPGLGVVYLLAPRRDQRQAEQVFEKAPVGFLIAYRKREVMQSRRQCRGIGVDVIRRKSPTEKRRTGACANEHFGKILLRVG